MIDYGEVYRQLRERVSAAVADASPDELARLVPATPAWSTKDVLAHVTGIVADMLSGNLAGVGTEEWTAAQVDTRRDRTAEEIIAEWAEIAPAAEDAVNALGEAVGMAWVSDAGVHEHDINAALGTAQPKATASTRIVLAAAVQGLDTRVRDTGLPGVAFRVATTGPLTEELTTGSGSPDVAVAVDRWELTRALSGRRSEAQVRSWAWLGDPEPYLGLLTPGVGYSLSPTDLED